MCLPRFLLALSSLLRHLILISDSFTQRLKKKETLLSLKINSETKTKKLSRKLRESDFYIEPSCLNFPRKLNSYFSSRMHGAIFSQENVFSGRKSASGISVSHNCRERKQRKILLKRFSFLYVLTSMNKTIFHLHREMQLHCFVSV